MIGARRRPSSPHAGPVDPTMDAAEACAPCHEFDFPDDVDRGLPPSQARMQRTISEWTGTPAALAGQECQACHMRRVAGHLDHRFSVREDLDRLRSAVELSARVRETPDATVVEVELRATDVGHAVPTGDLFRQLRLSVIGGDGPPQERIYARRFAPHFVRRPTGPPAAVRRDAADSRLFPGEPRRETFSFPPGVRIRVELDYLLMPPRIAEEIGVDEGRNRTRLFTVDPRAVPPFQGSHGR